MGLCVPYIHCDSYSFFTARLRQKGAKMRNGELFGLLLMLIVLFALMYDLHVLGQGI